MSNPDQKYRSYDNKNFTNPAQISHLFDDVVEILTLRNNQLPSLQNVPIPLNLQELVLSNNKLTGDVFDFFYQTKQLKTVELSRNLISIVNCEAISQSITELNLSQNKIVNANQMISVCKMPVLNRLLLVQNKMHSFDPPPGSFPELKTLFLNNNELKSLRGAIGLPKIEHLEAGLNQITTLRDCKGGATITHLDINSNQLQEAKDCAFLGRLPQLKCLIINLYRDHAQPFDCDCDKRELLQVCSPQVDEIDYKKVVESKQGNIIKREWEVTCEERDTRKLFIMQKHLQFDTSAFQHRFNGIVQKFKQSIHALELEAKQ